MKLEEIVLKVGCCSTVVLSGLVLYMLLSAASICPAEKDTWTKKADMPTARFSLATSVVDGKIYAIGGCQAGTSPGMQTVEEYNPATDTWTRKADMPTARLALATSVVDGKIYAIGGLAIFGTPGLSMVEVYDPVTDRWTTKAPMPTARFNLATSVVDGKIYAIGGTGSPAFWAGFCPTVEVYDPLTDTWSEKADMPTARLALATSVVDGKIYAIGGASASWGGLSTVEVYDPAADTWTTKTPVPTTRFALATSVVDGKIYAIRGGTGQPRRLFSVVEAYDPVTDTWAQKTDMPGIGFGLSASTVGGKVYAIGGSATAPDPHPGVRTVYEYDTGFVSTEEPKRPIDTKGKSATTWAKIKRCDTRGTMLFSAL
jgi:N-acetylneuraminic acid mutarotase